MKKTLIGLGCSHTQGCAIQKDGKLVSQQLKDLYNREEVSPEWVTENFSWIGHLGNLLGVDEKINFGFGGKGIEQIVRVVRNYSINNSDFSNHTFILQIPSFTRIELLLNNHIETLMNQVHNVKLTKETEFYLKYMYNQDFYDYYFLNEIYFLKKFIELSGGKFYSFSDFCPEFDKVNSTNGKKIVDKFDNLNNWSLNLTKNLSVQEIKENINLLNIEVSFDNTLHSDGLKVRDYHLSETGNKNLAKSIYKEIKNETTFT